MRSRINVAMMLAASFIVFIAVGSAKSVQTSGHQSPIAVLRDGGGPMCIPDAPCVYDFGVLASRARFRPGVLMADGTGPMCFPGVGCAYREGITANEPGNPTPLLLADGPGPMCFPGVGCGYRNDEAKMLWPS
jgi:uncharacterized protein (DUF779 family)